MFRGDMNTGFVFFVSGRQRGPEVVYKVVDELVQGDA
jgi:hypothetical protein